MSVTLGPLERGLNLIQVLARAKEPVGFTVLGQAMGGLNKATLSKLLKVLIQMGYVVKSEGGYSCGPALRLLSDLDLPTNREHLISLYGEEMVALTRSARVSTILFERMGENMVSIHKVVHESAPAMQEVGGINEKGLPTPWSWLLRYNLGDDFNESEEKIIKNIKKRGLAIDHCQHLDNIVRVGIGLHDRHGELIGCLAFAFFHPMVSPDQQSRLEEELIHMVQLNHKESADV